MDILAASEMANFISLIKEDLKGQNLEWYHEENKWTGLKAKGKRKEGRFCGPAKGISTTYRKDKEPSITLLKTAELLWKECRMGETNGTL